MDRVDRHFKQMASTLRVDRHVEVRIISPLLLIAVIMTVGSKLTLTLPLQVKAPPTERINYAISSPFTPGRYIPATLNNLLMPRTEFSRSNG